MTQILFANGFGDGGRFLGEPEPPCRPLILYLEERAGIDRVSEPVTVGLPLPQGMVVHPDELRLYDGHDHPAALQVQVLARWRDGSVKWAVVDFQANVSAAQRAEYTFRSEKNSGSTVSSPGATVRQSSDGVVVDTGRSVFFLNAQTCKPFDRVLMKEKSLLAGDGSHLALIDSAGHEYEPSIQTSVFEATGPLRATLCIQGSFSHRSRPALVDFIARLSFYAQSGLVKIEFTIRNPRAARHPGGLWDLGDEGSVYFRDLSLHVPLASEDSTSIQWTVQPGCVVTRKTGGSLEVYQDSSGGQNWNSANHVNRFGKVTTSFRGYRVMVDGNRAEEGERATPTVSVGSRGKNVTGALSGFWQNFPKAIEVDDNRLILRLFPRQYSDPYEMQGGEQKTHTLFLQFDDNVTPTLDWVHAPLIPRATPEWYASTRVFPYLALRNGQGAEDPLKQAEDLVDSAIEGNNTFFDRREIIDEYGWRHYGDLYADHEAIGHEGRTPLIAHYNNQYDVIFGAIVQYVQSGNPRWYDLVRDLARHVIDIDIYHTAGDRPAFNGGLFWHTEHYKDAATSTHRTYSKANVGENILALQGGGPACEHNYATGLLYYYFLTGDPTAKEAVCSLADWVINMDEARDGVLSFIDRRPTGLCSATADPRYHGPGRGAGNSISVLLDAFALTQNEKYEKKAEQLIRRCIHPRDDIEQRNLSDVEHRWSYTVFLQTLGKYLDSKVPTGEADYMYRYAKASLLHYAKWMLEHEVPYKQVLYKVEIPTETWPAQDVRKSNVFKFAAKYSEEPLRGKFLQKSEEFFRAAVGDLLSFETCRLTRPIVLLLTNSFMHSYSLFGENDLVVDQKGDPDFRYPCVFNPRFAELQKLRVKLRDLLSMAKEATRGIGR
ncbi:MAG: hypothetical protein HOP18_13110 [Deltaproteobacteria bacterium]|nr:hypothetical protein [Deltaproteobacteria bacterium]